MKQLPIKFQQIYENDCFGDDIFSGFTPFFIDDNHKVTRRTVEIEPAKWNQGCMLIVRILDTVAYKTQMFDTIPPRYEMGTETTEVHRHNIYDHYQYPEGHIIPTHEQVEMMSALAEGELRGNAAERMVYSLFINLVVLNPLFGLKEWLPEVVAFHQKLKDDYDAKNAAVSGK